MPRAKALTAEQIIGQLREADVALARGDTAASRTGVNLRTPIERIIARAGHKPWPRLLRNLRASCASDWVERYQANVAAAWRGRSAEIASNHYLMSCEHHFEDALNGRTAAMA